MTDHIQPPSEINTRPKIGPKTLFGRLFSITARGQYRPRDAIFILCLGIFSITLLALLSQTPTHKLFIVILVFCIGLGLYHSLVSHALSTRPISETPISVAQSHTENIPRNFEIAIAESLQEAIFIVDQRGLITYANKAAQKHFSNVVLRRPISSYMRDPDVIELVQETLKGNICVPRRITRSGNILQSFRVSGAPIRSQKNGENIIRRAVIIFTDITEIERANTQRADFLANASHELKTPIASILGYIETLKGHAKNDPKAQEMFLGIMQEQAQRMQRLITDILSLRKIEQIEHIVPTERADLGLAARAALEAVHPIAKSRKVKVRLSGHKKNALVMGSQDELVQLSLNLIDNAVRMSPSGSKVTVHIDHLITWMPGDEFSEEGIIDNAPRRRIVMPPRAGIDYWRLRIRDSGPGFQREHLPRLGERFYRIAGDRSSKEKGTGLGLAIVKHIARWHRGGLYIESAEGHGTEFVIIIPVAPSEVSPQDTADILTPDIVPIERGA